MAGDSSAERIQASIARLIRLRREGRRPAGPLGAPTIGAGARTAVPRLCPAQRTLLSSGPADAQRATSYRELQKSELELQERVAELELQLDAVKSRKDSRFESLREAHMKLKVR